MVSPLLRAFTVASRPHVASVNSSVISMQGQCRLVASAAHYLVRESSNSKSLEKLSANDKLFVKESRNALSTHHLIRIITFVDPNGGKHVLHAADGDTVLDVAKSRELEIEGACQGECACSTCHIIIPSKEEYERLSPSTEKEEDMLDLAFGVTNTSRLACQVRMRPELEGISIKLPGLVRDLRAEA